MAKRNIIIIIIIIAVVILGFVLSKNKTNAPINKKAVDVQAEINKIKTNQSSQNSTVTNNNTNTKPMQLEIKTTQEGTGSRAVKTGDTIDVYYTGKLTDGKTFDSNVGSGKPFEFTVGAGMVIQGWEQGFIGAKVGEKRTLTIPSNLGYGTAGAGGVIPPNAILIFDVELVSIK
jgi:FKBP-type peptidyl-prolyl cis-trans isomerase